MAAESGGGINGSPIPGEGKGVRGDETSGNGPVKESLFKNGEKKGIGLVSRNRVVLILLEEIFSCNAAYRIGLIPFRFRGNDLRMRFPDMRGNVIRIRKPETVQKVIEGRGTRSIAGTETGEDGEKRISFKAGSPSSNGDSAGFNGKDEGAQHGGRLSGRSAKDRIAFRQHGIHERKIQSQSLVVERLGFPVKRRVKALRESLQKERSDAGFVIRKIFNSRFHKAKAPFKKNLRRAHFLKKGSGQQS